MTSCCFYYWYASSNVDVVGIHNVLEDPAAVPVSCPPPVVCNKYQLIKNIHCNGWNTNLLVLMTLV